jgi:hypothetical protein
MGSRLKELVDFYNRLGEKKPELGMLVVEGGVSPFTFVVGYLKPSVVMLVPDKASAQGQPQIKVKAFSVRGVPEKDWDKLNEDIAIAQDEGRFYAERQLRRSVQPGQVSLHKASSLLVATGPESYIEMVESIVSAYHTNQVTVSPKKINF